MCLTRQYRDGCIENTAKPLDIHKLMVKKILIADNSASARYVIRAVLKDLADIEICGEAIDGLDAIEQAKKLKPDLVLLDLSMPRMNAAEVASILKEATPDVLIILFTMYSENIGKALTSAIGVNAVLSKPDGMSQLVPCVKAVTRAALRCGRNQSVRIV
jgi:DNA-binding NarL/FixJ family response regulator